jgi:energy-coupling factor transporter ATP-binding protein EcfA2
MRVRLPWGRGEPVFAPTIHADRLARLSGRPYRLTSDAWEAAPSFGFDFLADAIAKVILETEPQLTLAIYGPWGVGKTTLLRAIHERISEQCVVAWFDMWEYQNQEHVIALLIDAIASALPSSKAASGLRKLARVALASATLSAGSVSFSGNDLLGELDNLGGVPRVETQQLEHLIGGWRQSNAGRPIVVVVDNLDRCLPKHSVTLLDQITSLFGFTGVVFLLAAERDRLAKAVETTHRLKRGDGLVYLEKIVQVEFRVPGLYREDVLRWVRTLVQPPLALNDEDSLLLAETAGWNPRQIKRVLNNVRIQLCTARRDTDADDGLTLASTLLLHHRPDVWLALTGSEENRKELADALAAP